MHLVAFTHILPKHPQIHSFQWVESLSIKTQIVASKGNTIKLIFYIHVLCPYKVGEMRRYSPTSFRNCDMLTSVAYLEGRMRLAFFYFNFNYNFNYESGENSLGKSS